jgi:hypothetical protein
MAGNAPKLVVKTKEERLRAAANENDVPTFVNIANQGIDINDGDEVKALEGSSPTSIMQKYAILIAFYHSETICEENTSFSLTSATF